MRRSPAPTLRHALLAALAVAGMAGGPVPQAQAASFYDIITHTNSATSVVGHLCSFYGGTSIGCASTAPTVDATGMLTASTVATGGLSVTGATQLANVSSTGSLTVAGNAAVGGDATITGNVTAANFYGSFVGDGSGLTGVVASTGDRIVSGSTYMIADGTTGLISITQSGTNTAYFHPQLGLVTIGVSSTGAISATSGYIGILATGSGATPVSGFALTNGGRTGSTQYLVWSPNPGTASAPAFGYNYLTSGGGMFFPTSTSVALASGGIEAMRIVSSGYVGIGTSNPSYTLHVKDVIAIGDNVNSGLTRGLIIRQDNETSNAITLQRANGAATGGFYLDNTPNLIIQRGGGKNLVLTSAGFVGISGPTPTTALQVSGTIRMADGGEACDTNRTGAIRYNSGEFYVCRNGTAWESLTSIAQSAAVAADRITSGTTYMVAEQASGLISVTQNGTNTAYFHPQLGLVSIGVSTTGPISAGEIYSAGDIRTKYGSKIYVQGGPLLAVSGSVPVVRSNATTDPSLSFSAGQNFPEAMRIVSTGYVGIGTSNPSSTLHVMGISSGTNAGLTLGVGTTKYGYFYPAGSGSLNFETASSSGGFNFRNGSNYSLTLTGGGGGSMYSSYSAGIGGITYPSTSLHVSGTIRLADGGEACDANRTGAIRYNSGEFYVCRNGTAWESLTSIAQSAAVAADRITSGTTYMVAEQATGLVSITQNGTNTAYFHPQLGLVSVGVSTTGIISGTNFYSSGNIVAAKNITLGNGYYLSWGNGVNIFGDAASKYMAFTTSGIEAMRIVSSGFVGIGTNNPQGLLDISGSVGRVYVNAAGNYLAFTRGSTNYIVASDASGSLSFLTGGTTANNTRLNITSNGFVGIGTTWINPSTTLHVSGTIRLADGGEACDTNRTGAIRYNSGEFYVCRNGTAWESLTSIAQSAAVAADRITSGTTYVVAEQATGLVSITQSGTNTAYFHPQLGLVSIGVSTTGPISGTTGAFGYMNLGGAVSAYSGSGYALAVAGGVGSNRYRVWSTDGGNAAAPAFSQNSRASGMYFPDVETLAFSTSGTEAMRIVSNGNVGIGVGTPKAKIDTNGGILIPGEGGYLGLGLYWDSASSAWKNKEANKFGAYIRSGGPNEGSGNAGDIEFSTETSTAAGATADTSRSIFKRVVIRRAGDVRIASGTYIGVNMEITPTAMLEVAGTISATGLTVNGVSLAGANDLYNLSHVSASAVAGNLFAGSTSGATTGITNTTAFGIGTFGAGTNMAGANTAFGTGVLYKNTTGGWNTGVGRYALYNNTTGNYNAAIGASALYSNTTGNANTANGTYALTQNTSGNYNTATGNSALSQNTTGNHNTGTGENALSWNMTGSYNVAEGSNALRYADSVNFTVALGNQSGYGVASTTIFSNGTFLGYQSGYSITTGNSNTLIGYKAGFNVSGGSNNITLGAGTNLLDGTASNQLNIGNAIFGDLAMKRIGLGGITSPTVSLEVSGTISSTLSAANVGNFGNVYASGMVSTAALYVNGQPVSGGAGDLFALTHVSASVAGQNLFVGDTTGATTGITATTALGIGALGAGTNTGFANTAIGRLTLYKNTTGFFNTAVGQNALYNNTTGTNNTGMGQGALFNNTIGNWNTAVGTSALTINTTGNNNTALGLNALGNNSIGNNNTGLGSNAMNKNTSGQNNVASGNNALYWNTNGSNNVASGQMALQFADPVTNTVALGYQSAYGVASTTTFSNGIFIGYQSGYGITTGNSNTMIGYRAGNNVSSGSNNITLGAGTNLLDGTASNQLNIGNAIFGDISLKRIGIGITSPSAPLEVSGSIKISGDGTEGCASAADSGRIRMNPTTGRLQVCKWNP